MFKKLAVIVTFIFCITVISFAETVHFKTEKNTPDSKFYYSKEYGLKIKIPEGWMAIDHSSSEALRSGTGVDTKGVICVFKDNRIGSAPLIYIKSNFLDKVYSLEEYASILRENNLKMKKGSVLLDTIENARIVVSNGHNFIKNIAILNEPAGKETHVHYIFLKGRMSCGIIVSLPIEKFDEYKDTLENIAASLIFEGVGSDF